MNARPFQATPSNPLLTCSEAEILATPWSHALLTVLKGSRSIDGTVDRGVETAHRALEAADDP